MPSRPLISGMSTTTWRSNRPGRSRAGSRTSARLVAAMRMTPSLDSNPSISTRSWFRVCSRSSCPPPRPAPLWRPTASISSIKMIQGAFFLPWANRSLTREAPTPTNISTKSDPLMVKNGTPASPATARDNSVFPVPGLPTSSTPLGIRPPSRVYLEGFFRKSTISVNSSLASSMPWTLAKVTFSFLSSMSLARLFPKDMALPPPPPPCIWRMKKIHTPMRTIMGSQDTRRDMNQEDSAGGLALMATLFSRRKLMRSPSSGAKVFSLAPPASVRYKS